MQNPYARLARLDKPIGTLLLLWPTLWALFIAAHGHPPLYAVIVFSLGVFLTRSAGCAINDYIDVEFDKRVVRTRGRPLASNEISRKSALIVVFILSSAAGILAYTSLKPVTILLSIPAGVIFVTYPLTKRYFALPQAYLGIAFGFGIFMAFIELQNYLPGTAWLLFAANFFWVIGYDTIYASIDREDDLKIGIRSCAITFGKYTVVAVGICYALFVCLLAYLAYLLHFSLFFWLMLLYVVYLLAYQIWQVHKGSQLLAMFLLNNRVGYVVFAAIMLEYWR